MDSAHTLGDAKAAASGFEGMFTEHSQWLDNEYYTDMIRRAKKWRQVSVGQRGSQPKWQWVRPAKNGSLIFFF
ncbi:hypothetical protein EB796_009198 [Bugula neritina]|uniref:Uncharacterized protein n=1 Tax=Bugula neritina TaxID=10212 RepID=A0A7J7K301_BUGNE|nr:hypothetical protein EB796_009198 [Bugula neritina]